MITGDNCELMVTRGLAIEPVHRQLFSYPSNGRINFLNDKAIRKPNPFVTTVCLTLQGVSVAPMESPHTTSQYYLPLDTKCCLIDHR